MNPQLTRITEQRDALAAEARGILDRSADGLSDEDSARVDAITAELDTLRRRYEQVEKIDRAAGSSSNLERGDGAGFNVNRTVDPWSDPVRSSNNDEMRTRALAAVEQMHHYETTNADATRHRATGLVEQDPALAALIVAGSRPAYTSAITKYLRSPGRAPALWTEDERAAVQEMEQVRAAMSLVDAQGGYLVPTVLDPTIVLTNAGTANPFRSIASVKTTSADNWNGVTSAGVSAEWLAEANEATDASPTFGNILITPQKAAAWVQASFEVAADANFGNDVGRLFTDAKDRLEGTAFATGTGSGQPYGIVTELQLVTASRVATNTNAVYGPVDVYNLDNAVPSRYGSNASFLAHKSIFNLTRQFATGSGPQHAFWADFGEGRPPQLIGHNAYESSAMFQAPLSTATASNDDILILGDFSEYYIVDRIGATIVHEPLVKGANRRPTGEMGWFLYWRVGARVADPSAFRMLRA